MRTPHVNRLAATIIAAFPILANALAWDGNLGFFYDRVDSWNRGEEKATSPSWMFDVALGGRGFLSKPGVFDWSARANYRLSDSSISGGGSTRASALTFGARVGLFENPRSWGSLSLDASQTRTEFVLSNDTSGDGTLLRYGGGVTLRSSGSRSATASYHRLDTNESFPGVATHTRSQDLVNVYLLNGAGSFSVSGTYQGEWSDGSWTSDDFTQHQLSINGTGRLAREWELLIEDSYLQRVPTGAAGIPGAYTLESNAFRTGAQRMEEAGSRSFYYTYARSLISSDASSNEMVQQGLTALADFPLDGPSLYLRTNASVTRSSMHGTATQEGTGENVGLDLWWRDAFRPGFDAHAGPYFGALQDDSSGPAFGYGGRVGLRFSSHAAGDASYSASYEGSFSQDLYGVDGWYLRQDVQGAIAGRLSAVRWNATVTGNFSRSTTVAFGDSAARSVSVHGGLEYEDVSGGVGASTSDGVAPGASISGDGLFVPAPFDVHNRTLSAWVGAALWWGIRATVKSHYVVSESPGAPTLDVVGAEAALAYHYGGLDFRLRDVFTSSETLVSRANVNLVELRVSRSFSGRQ